MLGVWSMLGVCAVGAKNGTTRKYLESRMHLVSRLKAVFHPLTLFLPRSGKLDRSAPRAPDDHH